MSCAVRLAAVLCGVRCGCGCAPSSRRAPRGLSKAAELPPSQRRGASVLPRCAASVAASCTTRAVLWQARPAAKTRSRLRTGQVRRGMLNRTVAEGCGAEHLWVQQVLPRPESGFSWTSLQCAQVSARSSDIHEHRRLLVDVARPARCAPMSEPKSWSEAARL